MKYISRKLRELADEVECKGGVKEKKEILVLNCDVQEKIMIFIRYRDGAISISCPDYISKISDHFCADSLIEVEIPSDSVIFFRNVAERMSIGVPEYVEYASGEECGYITIARKFNSSVGGFYNLIKIRTYEGRAYFEPSSQDLIKIARFIEDN